MRESFKPALYLLIYFGIAVSCLNAQDQNIDFSTNTFIQHYQDKLAASITLNISTTAGIPPFTWAFCSGTGCALSPAAVGSSVTLGTGVTLQFQNNQVVLNVQNADVGIYSFTLRRIAGGAPAVQRNYRIIVRQPLRMVFALDRSGSMECEPTAAIPWPDCITLAPPERRWDVLGTAINNFLTKYDDVNNHHKLTPDRFSVVYFAGSLTPAGALAAFNDIAAFRPGISTAMNNPPVQDAADPRLGRDGTSIGAGLLESINTRMGGAASPSVRQVLVLFTDGEENAFPKVNTTGGARTIVDAASSPLLDLDDTGLDGIEIFSIGVGNLPSFTTYLQNITTNPGGNYFLTINGGETNLLGEMSGNAFNEIFNAFSPVLIRYEDQRIRDTITATFTCNSDISRLYFEAHFDTPTAGRFRYSLQKDGVNIPIDPKYIFVDRYLATVTVDFSVLPPLDSRGEWTLQCIRSGLQDVVIVTPSRAHKVRLSATADDHRVSMHASTGGQKNRVGDKMPLSVKFMHNDAPIEGAQVFAVIRKPEGDLGDYLARSTETPMTGNSELGTCAEQKYAALISSDPRLIDSLLRLQSDTVTLQYQGAGLYTGSYNALNVAGLYKVLFFAKGNVQDYGTVERMHEKSENILFGLVDLNLEKHTFGKQENTSTLHLRPSYEVNGQERYVGPGFSFGLGVQGAGVQQVAVTDDCDGSYTVNVEATGDPKVKVFLLDDPIYEGRLSQFAKPFVRYKWGVSLHAGATFPAASLDALYNGSAFAEVDLSYRFTPGFSVEAVGGYYGFQPSYAIAGVSIYAKGHVPIGATGWGLFGAAGGGFYKPKSLDATTGYSLRAGIEKGFGAHWLLSLEGSYFKLSDYDYAFSAVGLGVKFQF